MKTSAKITLKFPVTVAGETISELTMRRPLAVDVLASHEGGENDTDQTISLLANLCMVSPDTFGEIDAADFSAAHDAFEELTAFDPVDDYKPGNSIALGVPINIAGASVGTIALRRPKVRDLQEVRRAGGSSAKQECALFAALAGVGVNDILNLDWADMRKIKDIYEGFLA